MAIEELTKVESILNGNDYDKYGIQYILKKMKTYWPSVTVIQIQRI